MPPPTAKPKTVAWRLCWATKQTSGRTVGCARLQCRLANGSPLVRFQIPECPFYGRAIGESSFESALRQVGIGVVGNVAGQGAAALGRSWSAGFDKLKVANGGGGCSSHFAR